MSIMTISYADLHKSLQHADDWYWTEIESVLSYFPDENEITLTPDAFGHEISTLLWNLGEQLNDFSASSGYLIGAALRARATTSQTYWGPRITVRDIVVTDIPEDVEI